MNEAEVRRRMYRAPTPRERERWHAVWLLAQGWAAAVGRALERDAHTVGQWARAFAEGGPKGLVFDQTGGSPRVGRGATSRVEGGGAAITVAGRYPAVQLELEGSASVCNGTLRVGAEPEQLSQLSRVEHGTGSAPVGVCAKRPKKRLLKADPARREAFVGEYARRCRWRQHGREPRYSSPTRRTFRPMLICGASGC